ncbi:protein-L-isoaspartate O-methyltransferase [Streptomyces sp. NPDC001657]|uniref:protein-L-isoaspartate O-methyltransferase n=1 Tax=unclassified Streptomyces TaxID=2593676 RepID=UPI0033239436
MPHQFPSATVLPDGGERTLAHEVAAARAAMVARLEDNGGLRPGPVRQALLALPREVLMPQAYVRRSQPDQTPPHWDLLDWSTPEDRQELLTLLYSGESVLIQHEGEPLLGRMPAPRSGGRITSMSSTVGMTADLLQQLDLQPGHRVLDIGTGAAVTAAIACWICGDGGVVTLDRDQHVSDAAHTRLAALGYRATTVTGDGEAGWPQRAPYDRLFMSYAVPRVAKACVEQLAPGGRALATVRGTSPSWPGLAVITRTPHGQVVGELQAVEFGHCPGHGLPRIFLSKAFRDRISSGAGGHVLHSRQAPPADQPRALWLAVDHLRPGLVRNWEADHLMIGAPACGSWLTARPDGSGGWTLTVCGPRDIWDEIQTIAARWRAAGSPDSYRLHFAANDQWVSAGRGNRELVWPLPHLHDTGKQEKPSCPSPVGPT